MTLDFALTPRQRDLRARTRSVARNVLRDARSAERLATPEERFLATRPAYERLISEGFLRACLPTAVGGDNESLVDTAVVVEELFAENGSVALTLLGTVLGVTPVVVGGTPEQHKQFLAPFLETTGAPLAAFCSSEPGGSANAASPPPGEGVRTRAVRADGRWVINGRKKWVSSATGWERDGADLLCVVCRTDEDAPPESAISMIAVQNPSGVELDRVIASPGYRAHLLPEITLRDVTAPEENLLGAGGAGLRLSGASFAGASALVGLMGVALMRSAFVHAWEFARTEHRGGAAPILTHQAVGYALADAKIAIEAVRALSLRACWSVDHREPAAAELAHSAKVFASETAVRVITDLMRVVGVDSYDDVDPLGGLLQDALALPIFAGGNVGVRRRALHALLMSPDYDPLATSET
ncbi:acyl-CoA dehydrogenase family protein [Sporichthya polymorpha]|uniref:acyl-CoA dehydrogenase family protein n=1 Tax=Sporichthya polymorpha TaxID=35751 RepID=UPI0003762B04|nr:acyl-CoA dehydrogenase family protein [Sporichthya polymorpha]